MAPVDSNVISEIFQKCLVPRIWAWEKWEKSWKIIFFEKNYKSFKSFKNTLKRIFRGTWTFFEHFGRSGTCDFFENVWNCTLGFLIIGFFGNVWNLVLGVLIVNQIRTTHAPCGHVGAHQKTWIVPIPPPWGEKLFRWWKKWNFLKFLIFFWTVSYFLAKLAHAIDDLGRSPKSPIDYL